VDAATDHLLDLFLRAEGFSTWDVGERARHLASVADFLFQLDELTPSGELPPCWRRLIGLWISGQNPTQISQDAEVAACDMDAQAVSRWIDDVCWYRLPWGYNMLSIHLKHAAEGAQCALPPVCDYFSSLVKYGVHEPVACWLLSLGVQSRIAALRGAELVGTDVPDPKALLEWLLAGGLEALRMRGLDRESLLAIESAVASYGGEVRRSSRPYTRILLPSDSTTASLRGGRRLLLQRIDHDRGGTFRVLTLDGNLVGDYTLEHPDEVLWTMLETPEFVSAVVQPVAGDGSSRSLEVLVTAV
jgi:hypothetical protein